MKDRRPIMKTVVERFLEYVKFDTQSDENSQTFPSTEKQIAFAKVLKEEIAQMGIEVELDENGYVTGTLEGNIDNNVPVIGFIAHMDTTPEVSGKDVNPKIIKNFDGKDIILNEEKDIVLRTSDYPHLKNYIGKDLIVTDGSTVLGADDKAGIAEIMTAIEYLKNHQEIKHGKVKFAFTADEEIGRGVDKFDIKKFGAKYAYTLDGDEFGSLEFENFNAASAQVIIKGKNIHPGLAKGIMKNAIRIGSEFISLLPQDQKPEVTSEYEGFFHIYQEIGSVEKVIQKYIIRDHDKIKFESKKEFFKSCVEFMNKKYGKGTVELLLKDSYYNMKEIIEKNFEIIEIAKKSMIEAGVEPVIKPIRGGTDGARLSFMGLPTPNIFTGGHNVHGIYEYIPTFAMKKAVEVILNIVKEFAKTKK
jgi:tripeptide aminopeptidase